MTPAPSISINEVRSAVGRVAPIAFGLPTTLFIVRTSRPGRVNLLKNLGDSWKVEIELGLLELAEAVNAGDEQLQAFLEEKTKPELFKNGS